jgi:hypothetical protein
VRSIPLLLLLVPAVVHAQYSRERVSLVLRGEAALQRQEIGSAIEAFREAARDTSAARRSAAERMLGVIAWRFYGDDGQARSHFGAALATQRDSASTLVEMARLAVAEGRYRQAFVLADDARRSASDDLAYRAAVVQMGRTIGEAALAARLGDERSATPEHVDSMSMALALRELGQLVRQQQGRTEEAHQLLLTALVAGDGRAAATGVASYYFINAGDTAMHSEVPAAIAELNQLLPLWQGDATARSDRARIAAALARTRLFDAAALVAPRESEIAAYAAFCRRIERSANEYYRRTLLGQPHPDELTRAYIHAEHDLWPRLAWRGAQPKFFPAAADAELARRFGTLIELGITGGYYDLHMGHIVGEETRTVTQYGHSARVTFFVIDGIVTNGLQSWAWDDAGGHGGWQRRDTVVQVRPIFIEHTISLLVSGDPVRHIREQRGISLDSALDWGIAARDSIAYLPGVAGRLRRDGRDFILDSLRSAGVRDSALGGTFVRVASQLIRESSIVAHEGRHAIDDDMGIPLSPAAREFRAKLSEVAFAQHPKIVMSSIVHPNIGDATPHGGANAQVMLGLIHWMRAHQKEIPGFVVTRPILPQLPLLSDAQLRTAFRAMDPLAR